MKILGIIPARYGSSRFPGKPLVEIDGKPMIQRVYEGAKNAKSLSDLVVATDDERIRNTVESFGGKAIMTSSDHQTGTDRCEEASQLVDQEYDVIINIQGDEPFIDTSHIDQVAGCFKDEQTQIATLVKTMESTQDLFDPNKPKVLIDNNSYAIYFSRSPIPYLRGVKEELWTKNHIYYKHIGIYAYRKKVLLEITKLAQSKLELAESLEQLRWLENGYRIKTALTNTEAFSIDTPEDLEKLNGK